MIINVRLADGHTTFQFASRNDLKQVLGFEPGDDTRSAKAWAKWHLEDPDWIEVRTPFLRKHSIAFVVAAEDYAESDDDLPAKATAERRLANWREAHPEAES